MGRSPASSCLRIIACAGGDDAAEPNATSAENKSSGGDKRGWSFRKKSGKQRGLITSVVSETTPATTRTRETLESALLKSPSPDNNNNNFVSEKQQPFSVDDEKKSSQFPVVTYVDEKKNQSAENETVEEEEEQIDHKTELPVLVESKGTETEEDDFIATDHLQGPNAADVSTVEKDIITPEVENASKVEPKESETDDVVIIRKGSEEDVDESAIVIIQAAVRGFLVRRELLRSKKVIKLQAAVRGHLVRSQAMGSLRCVQAIVKMQTMVRARHSTKDGSRVSAISDKVEANAAAQKLLENKFAKHLMESTPKTKSISIKCDPTKPSSAWNWLERWMSVPKPEKTSKSDLTTEEQRLEETQSVKVSPQDDLLNSDTTVETKTETDLSSYESNKLAAQLSETEKMSQYDSPEASAEVYYDSIQSQPPAAKEPDSLLEEPEYVDGQPKHSLKRKASNPSFIAAQSKFEELTTSTGSNKAMSSKDGVLGEEGKTDVDSLDATNTKKDHSLEDVAPAELSGSECGTELSVTSSLDTLEKKSDAEGAESKVEAKLLEDDTDVKTDQTELIEIDVKDETSLGTVEDPKEKVENAMVEVGKISETQHESVISTPDSKKRRAEDESGPQAYLISEEALTPMTISESQATPASQASSSVKARKGKSEKSGSSQKRKVSKKITSSPKQETGTGGEATPEQEEGKEPKSGRRNSFGFDQEARESSGGKNSLPRFMQPTQSAKAKVQEHNSPRSSPDLQERDVVSVKKRHSLPGVTNGKQGSSPRIQRSASQAQQGTKDRKWQR
ncbi:PREDICTED: protein IQ-DOMAIN 32-like [Camelina sativa]|uniref:Protein IQ-DOMAIN 32-like n=1 Tax=Camelina sativa TaxID=90675 RepID=A0ABM0VQH7_CAMSA|nr:PREDICTED: protein IQ-DOMAIN 32-like [Camelina sativa]